MFITFIMFMFMFMSLHSNYVFVCVGGMCVRACLLHMLLTQTLQAYKKSGTRMRGLSQ